MHVHVTKMNSFDPFGNSGCEGSVTGGAKDLGGTGASLGRTSEAVDSSPE